MSQFHAADGTMNASFLRTFFGVQPGGGNKFEKCRVFGCVWTGKLGEWAFDLRVAL